MTVYLRADWGSTGEPGGYDLPGPVSEAYVHTSSWLSGSAAVQAAAMDDSTADLHVEVVPAKRMALRAVGPEQLVVDVAPPTVDVGGLGDSLEMVGPKASRVAAEMVDHVPVGDRGYEHFVGEPVHHHVRAAAFPLDHAVPGLGGFAGPLPAAALGIDNRANPQAIGEVMYAEHRITSPGVWSHAPGCPTSAGAPAFHSTVNGGRG